MWLMTLLRNHESQLCSLCRTFRVFSKSLLLTGPILRMILCTEMIRINRASILSYRQLLKTNLWIKIYRVWTCSSLSNLRLKWSRFEPLKIQWSQKRKKSLKRIRVLIWTKCTDTHNLLRNWCHQGPSHLKDRTNLNLLKFYPHIFYPLKAPTKK